MEFLFFVTTIAAVIWGIALLRIGGILPACLFTLATGICFGAPFFQLSLLTIDRALLGALTICYVVLRQSKLVEPKSVSSWDLSAAVFLVIIVANNFVHDWAWKGMLPTSRLIFYYLFPAVLYWLARQASVSTKSLRTLLPIVMVFGLYLAITAIAEWQQLYLFVFPSYIVSPEFPEFLGRGRGPLLNPSGNGILMCAGLGSLLLMWPRLSIRGRMFLGVAFVVFAIGLLATMTRCVWLGAVLSVFILVMVTFPPRVKRAVLISSAIMLTIVIGSNWQSLQRFKRDKDVSAAEMAQSSQLRPVLAYVAWRMFQDHPICGVGFGQYKKYDRYYLERDGWKEINIEAARPYHQHNILLSLLTETGLSGAVFLLVTLLTWCRAAWGLWRTQNAPVDARHIGLLFLFLITTYFANGMFQDVTIIPMVHMVLFFFAGLTVGQYLKYNPGSVAMPNAFSRPVRFPNVAAPSP